MKLPDKDRDAFLLHSFVQYPSHSWTTGQMVRCFCGHEQERILVSGLDITAIERVNQHAVFQTSVDLTRLHTCLRTCLDVNLAPATPSATDFSLYRRYYCGLRSKTNLFGHSIIHNQQSRDISLTDPPAPFSRVGLGINSNSWLCSLPLILTRPSAQ
jgi:hypothetical protein